MSVSLRARRQAAVACFFASASLMAAFVAEQARRGAFARPDARDLGAVVTNTAPEGALAPEHAREGAPDAAPGQAREGDPNAAHGQARAGATGPAPGQARAGATGPAPGQAREGAAASQAREGAAESAPGQAREGAAAGQAREGAAAPPGQGPQNAAPARPVEHVLLLTIDSMRGDQPWTGYARARTPNLSALAERSIVYERAYAVANVTAASLAALLSGRYPSELERTRCAVGPYRLGEGLAPFLKASGVTTSAAHGSALFASRAAPSSGFDEWRLVEGAAGLGARRSAVTGAALASLVEGVLASPPPGGRRFLWAHFVDPRHPYAPPADFPPSDHPTRGAYDGEIAYTDAMIGRVLDALGRSPLAGRTAVVVAGDHGEAFGEHGLYRHGRGAFDEEIRVPLMVYAPGVAPARVGTPRSTIDVAPTVAALFGLAPPPHWRGRSLLDDLGPEGAVTRPVVFDSPEWKDRPALRAVVLGQTKVVLEPGFTRLYDLGVDPGERTPVGDRRAVPAVKLARGLLSGFPFVAPAPCADEASPERPFNPSDSSQGDEGRAPPATSPPLDGEL